LGGEEGAALCIALLCTIVLRRRLSSKKRSTWPRKWLRRQRWDVFLWSLLDLQSFHWYTRCKFCIQVSIQVSWIQVFWSCIPYKKLESKSLNRLGWNRNASYFWGGSYYSFWHKNRFFKRNLEEAVIILSDIKIVFFNRNLEEAVIILSDIKIVFFNRNLEEAVILPLNFCWKKDFYVGKNNNCLL
jgi:hypothetical protein